MAAPAIKIYDADSSDYTHLIQSSESDDLMQAMIDCVFAELETCCWRLCDQGQTVRVLDDIEHPTEMDPFFPQQSESTVASTVRGNANNTSSVSTGSVSSCSTWSVNSLPVTFPNREELDHIGQAISLGQQYLGGF